MTATGFSEWYADAAVSGLYGQSPRTIAEMAWQAGYRARKSQEFEALYDAQGHRDELKDMFPRHGTKTGRLTADYAPVKDFIGRTDPGYELPGPKLTDEDVRQVKDSLAPGLLPGMTAGQEAYDRHFGAPGAEDGEYDDETF